MLETAASRSVAPAPSREQALSAAVGPSFERIRTTLIAIIDDERNMCRGAIGPLLATARASAAIGKLEATYGPSDGSLPSPPWLWPLIAAVAEAHKTFGPEPRGAVGQAALRNPLFIEDLSRLRDAYSECAHEMLQGVLADQINAVVEALAGSYAEPAVIDDMTRALAIALQFAWSRRYLAAPKPGDPKPERAVRADPSWTPEQAEAITHAHALFGELGLVETLEAEKVGAALIGLCIMRHPVVGAIWARRFVGGRVWMAALLTSFDSGAVPATAMVKQLADEGVAALREAVVAYRETASGPHIPWAQFEPFLAALNDLWSTHGADVRILRVFAAELVGHDTLARRAIHGKPSPADVGMILAICGLVISIGGPMVLGLGLLPGIGLGVTLDALTSLATDHMAGRRQQKLDLVNLALEVGRFDVDVLPGESFGRLLFLVHVVSIAIPSAQMVNSLGALVIRRLPSLLSTMQATVKLAAQRVARRRLMRKSALGSPSTEQNARAVLGRGVAEAREPRPISVEPDPQGTSRVIPRSDRDDPTTMAGLSDGLARVRAKYDPSLVAPADRQGPGFAIGEAERLVARTGMKPDDALLMVLVRDADVAQQIKLLRARRLSALVEIRTIRRELAAAIKELKGKSASADEALAGMRADREARLAALQRNARDLSLQENALLGPRANNARGYLTETFVAEQHGIALAKARDFPALDGIAEGAGELRVVQIKSILVTEEISFLSRTSPNHLGDFGAAKITESIKKWRRNWPTEAEFAAEFPGRAPLPPRTSIPFEIRVAFVGERPPPAILTAITQRMDQHLVTQLVPGERAIVRLDFVLPEQLRPLVSPRDLERFSAVPWYRLPSPIPASQIAAPTIPVTIVAPLSPPSAAPAIPVPIAKRQ